MRARALLLRAAVAAACALPALPADAQVPPLPPVPLLASGTTTRISDRLDGTQHTAFADLAGVSISGNGRYAVYSTRETPGFPHCRGATVLRDLSTGRLEMISVPAGGCRASRVPLDGANTGSSTSISRDGRYVAFSSGTRDLIPGKPLPKDSPPQVYLRDRMRKRTVLVSVGYQGHSANGHARHPSVSDDGRWVAFESNATNLIRGDKGDPHDERTVAYDVFLRDVARGVTVRVGPEIRSKGRGPKFFPSLSGNGRYVVFDSDDGYLAPHRGAGDTLIPHDPVGGQIWVWDRISGRTELVSRNNAGYPAAGITIGGTGALRISRDGRWITYQSDAANLRGEEPTGLREHFHIYLYDRVTKSTIRVTDGQAGEGGNGESEWACISGDGRYITFDSAASNLGDVDLTPGHIHGFPDVGTDIFRYDRITRTTRLVSRSTEGLPGDRLSEHSCPSDADGRAVVFISRATTLVRPDSNDAPDVFVHRFPA